MDVMNTAFYESEDIYHACAECGSTHMQHPFDTSFCSQVCYTTFYNFINEYAYDNEPVERHEDYDQGRNPTVGEYDDEYEYDDDNMSCASDETYLSIYTYERRGKHCSRQLKKRILVKVSEKYGAAYDTGTV
jgi:hypothetical protein